MQPSNYFNKHTINYIRYSQDNSLLILSTQWGYKVLETKQFRMISHLDQDIQEYIGNITLGSVLFKSRLIFFVGKENNCSFPNNQLTIWDDENSSLMGKIVLKKKITYISVTNLIIFVAIGLSLYLFDIKALRLIRVINDLYFNPYNEIPLCITNQNQTILAYIENQKIRSTKYVSFIKFERSSKGQLTRQWKMINTYFSEVQKVAISKDETVVVIVSQYGNKVHIYSLTTFLLKCCLFTGYKITFISSITFDSKGKYLLFLSKKGKMEIYLISNTSKLLLCDCDEHDDKLLFSKNNQSKSFFEVLVDEISKKLFDNGIESYCEILLTSNSPNYLLYVDFKRKAKDEIVLIYNDGLIRKIKFDRKTKGSCWIESDKYLFSNIK